jgi:hypothetical protein
VSEEIRALVAEIEEATAEAQRRAQARSHEQVKVSLAHDLGSVTLNGYGDLVSVDLDAVAIRFVSEVRVAQAVKDAIRGGQRG